MNSRERARGGDSRPRGPQRSGARKHAVTRMATCPQHQNHGLFETVRIDDAFPGVGGGSRTPTGIFSPTDFHANYGFHRRHEAFVVWTIPSPWRMRFRCCPSSLYTFPLPGLARDCHAKGFPEFEQFCICGFLQSTLDRFKSVASTSSATPTCQRGLIVVGSLLASRILHISGRQLILVFVGTFGWRVLALWHGNHIGFCAVLMAEAGSQSLSARQMAVIRDIMKEKDTVIRSLIVWANQEVWYARYSRNGVFAVDAGVERYSPRQNELVGRSEIRPLSEADQVVGTMHRLAG